LDDFKGFRMMELRLSLAPPSRAGEPGFVGHFRLKNAIFRLFRENSG
jgi:hypothetical protein